MHYLAIFLSHHFVECILLIFLLLLTSPQLWRICFCEPDFLCLYALVYIKDNRHPPNNRFPPLTGGDTNLLYIHNLYAVIVKLLLSHFGINILLFIFLYFFLDTPNSRVPGELCSRHIGREPFTREWLQGFRHSFLICEPIAQGWDRK